jgi:hypothetical protein
VRYLRMGHRIKNSSRLKMANKFNTCIHHPGTSMLIDFLPKNNENGKNRG